MHRADVGVRNCRRRTYIQLTRRIRPCKQGREGGMLDGLARAVCGDPQRAGHTALVHERFKTQGTTPMMSSSKVTLLTMVAVALSGSLAIGQQNVDDTVPVLSQKQIDWHLPAPEGARTTIAEDLKRWQQPDTDAKINALLDRIDSIRRPKQVEMSLSDVIERTLRSNYSIVEQSYTPAIASTAIVQAQAAFDGAFFSNMIRTKTDQPTANELVTSGSDFFSSSSGLDKLLPSGAVVSGRYDIRRIKQTLSFQTLNPAYTSQFVLTLNQPLLRGFGLDYNRRFIVVAEKRRAIGDLSFRSTVEDTLRQAERLYWSLVLARRSLVARARLIADFEAIYDYLQARSDFDVLPVNLFTTEASLKAERTNFLADQANVLNIEDQLVALMNDPGKNLVDNVELVPTDFPSLERVRTDSVAEAQLALEHRPDILSQELQVEIKRIDANARKNEELPQLDLSFTVTSTGLGGNANSSFDEVSRNEFINYDIRVQYRLPIGNRSARALHRQEELLHAQEAARLRRIIEGAIRDVNIAVRNLDTSYDQITPGLDALEARQREVNSQVARAERKNYATLTTELGAWRALSNTRIALLRVIVDYNNAIVDLEFSKGTLLQHYNIVIPTELDGSGS